MFTFLTVLIVIASILLVLVVLIQKPKGGGLAAQFSSSNLAFGVKRTTDFIEKSTWGLAIIIIVLSLATNFFIGSGETTDKPNAINQEQIENLPSTPFQQPQSQPTDAQPAEGGEQPAGGGDIQPE